MFAYVAHNEVGIRSCVQYIFSLHGSSKCGAILPVLHCLQGDSLAFYWDVFYTAYRFRR